MLIKKYLFYISQNYSFEILRPLQQEIFSRGGEVKWLAVGEEINRDNFSQDEKALLTISDAVDYQPDACFVPGNDIPSFISGLKVQVFHGLEWKKKGHFAIRGFFDLYCTHGPATTDIFNKLSEQHGYFDIVETGWPKLDNLFNSLPMVLPSSDKPVILYAPTFSPKLTSAPKLFAEIQRLAAKDDYYWLIKFHSKMDKNWINKYQCLVEDNKLNNIQIIDADLAQILHTANIMISDTSSVIGEFALLNKAIVTLNNKAPGDYLIDIQEPGTLEEAINKALNMDDNLRAAIKTYAQDLHPHNDGQASKRILDAVENILKTGKKALKSKPLNLFRHLKQRKKLCYWRL